jgi:hypothetical protein
MAKERKTARELEVLIFNEARKARECEGMTGVTAREIADARVDYNWQVSFNATPACAQISADIVTRLQQLYDLAPTADISLRSHRPAHCPASTSS